LQDHKYKQDHHPILNLYCWPLRLQQAISVPLYGTQLKVYTHEQHRNGLSRLKQTHMAVI